MTTHAPPTISTTAHALPLAHEAIAQVAARQPDAIAVECRGERLTYAQLDQRATRLAQRLRARGAKPGDLAGLCVERSVHVVVAMLGAWKSGLAYVPLDPEYPPERRAAILADARPHFVLATTRQVGEDAGGAERVLVDADEGEDAVTGPEGCGLDLAYVLYTSGSTGKPKGVMVDHAALAWRVEDMRRSFGIGPGDRVSQYPSINWDASLFDTLVALVNGATLLVAAGQERMPGEPHHRFLREARVSAALMPPSVLAALPEAPLPDLRVLFLGGESLSAGLVARWGPGRRVYNLYGPTETTVWSTTDDCRPGVPVTIGRPVLGAYARALDDARRPLPEGETGEICIGGAGLARGYLGRPDLTSERWIEDPLRPDAFVYRTGDVGRLLPDGRVECFGRLDRQVKVRGMRIEPAEVEAALAEHPKARDVAVEPDVAPNGETRLVAYVVPRDAAGLAHPRRADPMLRREWRAFLAPRFPDPMVPSVFVEVPALPLTPNGKIDRKALPSARALLAPLAGAEAPRDAMERLVADAWASALGLDAVGLHESFFDLGGHSLLVADVQARLAAALGRPVDAVALFEHPTVAQLARHLAATAPGAHAPVSVGVDVGVPVPVQDAASRAEARLAARGRRRPAGPASSEVSHE